MLETIVSLDSGDPQILPVIDVAMTAWQGAADLIVAEGAQTILLADCRSIDDLQRCDMALSVAEARAGRAAGSVRIVVSASSAAGLLALPTLGRKSMRLTGVNWDCRTFCAGIGCAVDSALAEYARLQLVIAAKALGLQIYDCAEEEISEAC